MLFFGVEGGGKPVVRVRVGGLPQYQEQRTQLSIHHVEHFHHARLQFLPCLPSLVPTAAAVAVIIAHVVPLLASSIFIYSLPSGQ